jgi:hypothetical protein
MNYTNLMKYKILFVICLFSYSTISLSGCSDSSISSRGETASEAIESTRLAIPLGYIDNSSCTSPIISCDTGFDFDDSGEYCLSGTEIGEVKATLAITTTFLKR